MSDGWWTMGAHPSKYTLLGRRSECETLERVVGGGMDPEPYLRYLGEKLGALTA